MVVQVIKDIWLIKVIVNIVKKEMENEETTEEINESSEEEETEA